VEIDLDPNSDPKKPDPLDGFDAQWHHVAVAWRYAPAASRNKLDALLLLDGAFRDNTVEVDGGTARGGRPALLNLFVGKNRGGYERVRNNPFKGQIRQIRFWSRRLSEADLVAAAATPLTGDESGLQAILLLDEGQGNALRNAALYGTLRLGDAPAPQDAWYQPGSRRVLRLDGYDLALPRAADLRLASDFTVESWINLASLAGDQPLLATRGPKFDHASQDFALGVREGQPYAWLQGHELRADDLQLAANTWHHIAWKYSAGELGVFLDGAPSRKVFANLDPYSANRLIFAGRRRIWDAAVSRWVEGHLVGLIDQLRAWRVARPADALRRDMLRFLSGDEPDLAACWRFASGEPQIDDSPVPAPKLRLAATLDGYNDYVDTGELFLAGSAAWTIECWVSRSEAADSQTIFSQRGVFSAALDGKRLRVATHAGQLQSWEIELAPDQWHHLALSYGGTELRLFLDGADLGARSMAGLALGAGGLLLGADANDLTGAFLRGAPAELRLWSVARTIEQIQADYRRLLSRREVGLEGWWRLDADPGFALADSCEILPPATLVAGLENTAKKWVDPPPHCGRGVGAGARRPRRPCDPGQLGRARTRPRFHRRGVGARRAIGPRGPGRRAGRGAAVPGPARQLPLRTPRRSGLRGNRAARHTVASACLAVPIARQERRAGHAAHLCRRQTGAGAASPTGQRGRPRFSGPLGRQHGSVAGAARLQRPDRRGGNLERCPGHQTTQAAPAWLRGWPGRLLDLRRSQSNHAPKPG
jgi:Concanavalin A-like lectin/glucanases superfamily